MAEDHPQPPERDPLPPGRHKVSASAGSFAGIGLQFAAVLLVFVFAGVWLDRRLGTNWATPVLVLIGAAAGIYSMYRRLVADQRQRDAERRARSGGSPPRPPHG